MNTHKSTHLFCALCRVIREEQREYVAELLSQPPTYILSHAQEYVVREKIKSCIGLDFLTADQIRGLLTVEKPLDTIYRSIDSRELIAVDDLIEGVIDTADYCVSTQRIADAIMTVEAEVARLS